MNRAPKSLAELKEIAGIGEAFCRDYGAGVLRLLGEVPAGAPPDPTGEAQAEAAP